MTTKQEQRQQENRERLQAAVAEISSEAGFRRWLQVRAAMHDYSLNNTLLIAMQRPDATQVAGYRKWQELDRQVRQGEKGIVILAPVVRKVEDEETGETVKRVVGFRGVYVFDVAQTDGEDLGQAPETAPISGESHAEMLPKLEQLAGTLGYTVESKTDLPEGVGGYCDPQRKVIVVKGDDSANERVATLTHEIAHAMGVGYREFGRDVAEVIVEAATCIALASFGLETDARTVPYVAGWAKGDAEQIEQQAQTIDRIARQLTEGVE